MAEETDKTKKTNTLLIKHTAGNTGAQSENENASGKPSAEQGERRKVKVLVKKSSSSSSLTNNAVPKKTSPKVVVSAPSAVTSGKQSGSKKQENDKKQGSDPNASRISSFPIAQRPAAAAGRVGGKLVGNHQRPARGTSSQGTRGNTQQGARVQPPQFKSANKPGEGFTNRNGFAARQQPGQRPPFPPKPGFKQGGAPGAAPRGAPGAANRGGFNRPSPNRGGAAAPAGPIPEGKGPAKRKFLTKKPVYNRKEKELEMEEKLLQTKKKITHVANPVPKSIDIMEVISVSELARKMNLKASDLIQKLMSMGQMVTINQQIDADTATILAAEFGADVKIVSLYDETVIETSVIDDDAVMLPRPPVITVMGHVDHGKTKLLDAIRKADVVSGEFGGITQHIGAYMVETPHGSLTFLDTPGHEAFTRMRARGAQITDIVILVVAADDGVMPQTIEAINHAKDADVPIIVAVNKIDKPEANPDKVKSQLSDLGLMPEDWGGQTMFIELSALQKTGIDKLIDAILLESELLDLKANFQRSAEGKILESKVDHGRGIVATVMVEKGTLIIGDAFVAGIWPGKVRAIFNDKGEKINKATPSMPVEVLGFEGIPNAGDPLQVVSDEKVAREFSSKRQELKRFEDAKIMRKVTMDNLHDMISDGTIQELKVIIKADVQGSAEALKSSLEKLSTKEIRLHVIQALPGPVNEGDVDLAIASKAIIISFNVRPLPKAKILAEQEKVDIRKYNVIYKAVEEIKQAMEGMLKPDTKEEVIATVEVRDTFKVPKIGTIAGCYVLTGTVKRSCSVNVIRNQIVVYSGKLASLKRFKDDAREVAAGYECGIGIDGFDDIQIGDALEIIEAVQIARKLSASIAEISQQAASAKKQD
ncbi:MAG: translation initiation factor IF-2 [Treponema sp.]|nr:translation initiation factor IF-2 [Treponema sp.]